MGILAWVMYYMLSDNYVFDKAKPWEDLLEMYFDLTDWHWQQAEEFGSGLRI